MLSKERNGIVCAILFRIALLIVLPAAGRAQGNLLITPRRIVFEGGKRTEELNLANSGNDTARFIISLIEMTMKENGTISIIEETDSGPYSAAPYLRYYPHEVVLGPNEAQTVKVQVSKNVDFGNGECRSHFYFRARSADVPLGDTAKKSSSSITVAATPTFGLCIPVIIRAGENNTRLSISGLSLSMSGEKPKLNMTFQREGNMSVYGDLTVDHISPDGKTTRVGVAKGIAVYTSINKRHFSIVLDNDAAISYSSGRLQVSFTENNSASSILAAGTLPLTSTTRF